MQMENPYIQYMYSYPHKTAYRALKDIDLRAYFSYLQEGTNSLYFHIPFCQTKCGYCNLFSLAGQPVEQMQDYVNAMERQAAQLREALPEDVTFSDLTLGGGTPLILPEHLLERIFYMAREYFGFSKEPDAPVIVETSPNQTTESKLELLKEQGVTRVSIGVQSFQEKELRAVSRLHTVESARKALERIKKANFSCLNIDLIYGIPGQTKESLLDSLAQALAYEPEELFVYPLYVKPGTILDYQKQKSYATLELYQIVRETLKEHGYQPYSMRRFVKTCQVGTADIQQSGTDKLPHESISSLCGFGNTLSVGCGGRSYIGNLHFCTPYAVKQKHCLELVKEYIGREDYLQASYGYLLNEEEQKRRYIIKHILFETGIVKADYRQHFGSDPMMEFPQLGEWIAKGYAKEVLLSAEQQCVSKEQQCVSAGQQCVSEEQQCVSAEQQSVSKAQQSMEVPPQSGDKIILTEEGFALSDYLGPQLISPEVRAKMKEWRETDGAGE